MGNNALYLTMLSDAQLSLTKTEFELRAAKENPYSLKWVICAVHSAMQALMVLFLKPAGFDAILKREDAKRYLAAQAQGRDIPADLNLASFMELYKRIQDPKYVGCVIGAEPFSPTLSDTEIGKLNNARNRLTHFYFDLWVIEPNFLFAPLDAALEVIQFCVESPQFPWYDPQEAAKTRGFVEDLQSAIRDYVAATCEE